MNIDLRCQNCPHLLATPDIRGKERDNKYIILSLDFLNIKFNFTGLIAYIGLDLLTI